MKTIEAYMIYCGTGCTCCSSENHYRGFYKTEEEANRRIQYFYSPTSKFWPLASQYATRGRYSVEKVTTEEIGDGRFILNNDKILQDLSFVELNVDGSIENNEDDYLFSDLY
jgi:hypothetical protein